MSQIWRDDAAGMAVYVNGGYVDINIDHESTRLEPDEAVTAVAALTVAVAEAAALAARWDGKARRYTEAAR